MAKKKVKSKEEACFVRHLTSGTYIAFPAESRAPRLFFEFIESKKDDEKWSESITVKTGLRITGTEQLTDVYDENHISYITVTIWHRPNSFVIEAAKYINENL